MTDAADEGKPAPRATPEGDDGRDAGPDDDGAAGRETDEAARLLPALLAWYDRQRRDLAWRARPGEPADPYHVLVSEFMLQQTTVATVARRFPDFLARFPSIASLAAAETDSVLHAWQGLGYYRRARALHACAQAAVERHGGDLPDDEATLLALPGIGPYTAKALLAIAHGRPVVPVDGNVERLLARLYAIEAPPPAARAEIERRAKRLVPQDRASDVAQALMELGSTVCRPRRPACPLCPWFDPCLARQGGEPERLPVRAKAATKPVRHGLAFLLRRDDGALLFRRRPEGGLLGGLHDLPSGPWLAGPLDLEAALGHAPARAEWRLLPGVVRHVFSHFTVELRLAEASTPAPPLGLWRRPGEEADLALATLTRKLLAHAGWDRPG